MLSSTCRKRPVFIAIFCWNSFSLRRAVLVAHDHHFGRGSVEASGAKSYEAGHRSRGSGKGGKSRGSGRGTFSSFKAVFNLIFISKRRTFSAANNSQTFGKYSSWKVLHHKWKSNLFVLVWCFFKKYFEVFSKRHNFTSNKTSAVNVFRKKPF